MQINTNYGHVQLVYLLSGQLYNCQLICRRHGVGYIHCDPSH